MTERFRFDEEILDRAEHLRRQKLSWATIAGRLGCKATSLKVTVLGRKSGKWKGHYLKEREEIERMVVEEKRKPSEIARILKVSRGSVSQRLARMGLDSEMRRELQKGDLSSVPHKEVK